VGAAVGGWVGGWGRVVVVVARAVVAKTCLWAVHALSVHNHGVTFVRSVGIVFIVLTLTELSW
jgi:hypothetical protein